MNGTDKASNRSRSTLGIAIVICLSLLFSGCTSTRFHSPSQGANLSAEIRVGDKVDCRMNDGTQKVFTVTAVEPAALVGESVRVPVADISSIEVTRLDGTKTIKETGKVVGGVVLLTGLLALCLASHGFPIGGFK
jgi:hypothetical protein